MDDGPELRRPLPPLTWRERIESIADATGVTPARLVGGGLAVGAALIGALWLLRPPAEPVEVALPFASTTSSPAATSTSSTEPASLVVHVAGAVMLPGVHEVPAGSRVADAIAAAGGLAPGADEARINLAAPVADGERIYVPVVGEEPPAAVVGSSGGSSAAGGATASGGPINLNTADEVALDSLPGVGPATAAAIIEHRERIGGFTSVEQLLDVRGIGEAKLEQLRDLVTV